MDRQLLPNVYDVLDHAGFLIDEERGLTIESLSETVRVRCRSDYSLLRPAIDLATVRQRETSHGYGNGIQAAVTTAIAAVLEQAGYSVQARDCEIFVTASAAVRQRPSNS
ncbi:hypothetical protein [Catenulispora acidiphila]|uniref:hypothetical protein n=1 Tax=Catenulispora acidiphila TaxID=304895 RepID=UPI00117E0DB0|nr:hypothetical protein [Catenulispora acidiphila]